MRNGVRFEYQIQIEEKYEKRIITSQMTVACMRNNFEKQMGLQTTN